MLAGQRRLRCRLRRLGRQLRELVLALKELASHFADIPGFDGLRGCLVGLCRFVDGGLHGIEAGCLGGGVLGGGGLGGELLRRILEFGGGGGGVAGLHGFSGLGNAGGSLRDKRRSMALERFRTGGKGIRARRCGRLGCGILGGGERGGFARHLFEILRGLGQARLFGGFFEGQLIVQGGGGGGKGIGSFGLRLCALGLQGLGGLLQSLCGGRAVGGDLPCGGVCAGGQGLRLRGIRLLAGRQLGLILLHLCHGFGRFQEPVLGRDHFAQGAIHLGEGVTQLFLVRFPIRAVLGCGIRFCVESERSHFVRSLLEDRGHRGRQIGRGGQERMGQIVDLQGNGLLLGGNASFIFSVGTLIERAVLPRKDRGRQGGDLVGKLLFGEFGGDLPEGDLGGLLLLDDISDILRAAGGADFAELSEGGGNRSLARAGEVAASRLDHGLRVVGDSVPGHLVEECVHLGND